MKFLYVLLYVNHENKIKIGTYDYAKLKILMKQAPIGKTIYEGQNNIIYINKFQQTNSDPPISLICVSEQKDSETAFSFLESIVTQYNQNKEFTQEYIINNINDYQYKNKFDIIKEKIKENKEQMTNNLDILLERGEKIEEVISKAEQLQYITTNYGKSNQPISQPIIERKQVIVEEIEIIKNREDQYIYYSLMISSIIFVILATIKMII